MKNYSKLKWLLFIPGIGVIIIFFAVLSECQFRPKKLFAGLMIALFISALLGVLIGELIFFLIVDEIVYEKLIRMAIALLFLHIGLFVWCLIISRMRIKAELKTEESKKEKQEGESMPKTSNAMKDYSKIRWFLLLPILGILIVSFLVIFEEQSKHNNRILKLFLCEGISGVIGAILFVIVYAIIMAVNGSISNVVTIILACMVFVFMHIGLFIWCSVTARRMTTDEQNV